MKRILARFIAVVSAVGVLAVPGVSTGFPQPCVRAIGIDQQVSAGEGTTFLAFTVHSGGCAAAGTVNYVVDSGSAQANVDFHLVSGSLQWAAGDTSDRVIVAVIVADQQPEAYLEDFFVELVTPSPGIRVMVQTGQGRVLDDDVPTILQAVDDGVCPPAGLWAYDVGGESGDCGVREVISALQTSPVTVRWRTIDGTAIAGIHYIGVPEKTQTVPPGAGSIELKVKVLRPQPGTPALWFAVVITGVSHGRVVDTTAIVTIAGTQ